jgi:hypothetical protein
MGWLIVTLIGIATIHFMIVSPGFRVLVLVLIGGTAIAIYSWTVNSAKQSAQYEAMLSEARVESQNERRNAVKTTDLLLQDVKLNYDSWWTLEGVVANNSKKPLASLHFTVTMLDCPPRQECRIIGQESVHATTNVPAGQTRAFSTDALDFKNMPRTAYKRWRYELIEVGTGCDDECWAAAGFVPY